MNKKIYIITAIVISFVFIILSINVTAAAMGKNQPKAKEDKPQQLVSPEIEIITKPEQNIRVITPEEQKPETPVAVSPVEIIPPSGNGASAAPVKNNQTTDIQTALKNAGFDPGPIDGKAGPKTKKAIKDFQKANNLTVDGKVGPKTWAALKPYLNKAPSVSVKETKVKEETKHTKKQIKL